MVLLPQCILDCQNHVCFEVWRCISNCRYHYFITDHLCYTVLMVEGDICSAYILEDNFYYFLIICIDYGYQDMQLMFIGKSSMGYDTGICAFGWIDTYVCAICVHLVRLEHDCITGLVRLKSNGLRY